MHTLTCHRNVDMTLWSLKSFAYFVGESPSITIHDDGTLTAADKALLDGHLDRCQIIDKALADETMAERLAAYPLCRQMRARKAFYCALKLFDPAEYAKAAVILLIDSDVLFFQRPGELLTCVRQNRPCFNSDYQDAYAEKTEDLQRRFGMNLLPKVNMGLAVMRRADYDLEFMERYFSHFPYEIRDVNRHEQTLYALLMSRLGAHRLGSAYQLSRQPIRDATVSHHFVNDGSRADFNTLGLRALRQTRILDVIKGSGSWDGGSQAE